MDESMNTNITEPGFRNGSSSCEEDDEERKDLIPSSLSPPKDKYNMIYIIMFILSLGVLFPYQSYVAGLDYFTYLYPSYKPELALPLSNIIAALLSITVSIGIINYLSISFRLNIGYVFFIICLSTVLLLDIGINNCTISTETGFALTLLSALFSGFGGGIQQSTLYGLSGMLPERFTQCLMFGEAAAGSIVAINRIITKASSGSERTGTLIFFSISLFFIIACVGLQFVLRKSPFVKYYFAQNTSKENKRFELNCRSIKNCQCLKRRDSVDTIQLTQIGEKQEEEEEDTTSKYEFKNQFKNHLIDGLVFRYRILKKIWQPFISVFLIFFVTLLVFPSITSDVQYCKIGDWPIVIHTSLFNFADTIARALCLLPYRVSPKSLLIISI
ncbi:PREDICTED: equilibrative nucleoside transporter 4-like, partial [Amphimedon queenslandica]|uniref:Uncharacterized protein n=2 Tax=Amphimedon queenslandica TaxID=400682 RepID=A0AAN0IS41_AMPQE